MGSHKIHILGTGSAEPNTIVFGRENGFQIHPDDSIRTIKMKILQELHNADHANQFQLRPSYEELYLYAFVKEETSTLNLFSALKTEDEPDPVIPLDLVKQLLQTHPKSQKILSKLSGSDKIPYNKLEDVLSQTQTLISVKTPLGIQFAGGRRNPTFETDPFSVENYGAYLMEHSDLHHFDDSLLLNYGEIVDDAIYVCLAGRVYETTHAKSEDYIARYYYPGLYKNGISSNELLTSKRESLIKKTTSLLTEARLQHYRAIQTFYEIGADTETQVEYLKRGIQSVTMRLKSNTFTPISFEPRIRNLGARTARNTQLEMLFKNLHSRKETPYIKFNPGNRREHIYRFYFERTTRTGKKIPYLSRVQIMRMMKTTGKAQQISIYLEGVVLQDRRVSTAFLHFESTGDIQLQFAFSTPIDERTLDGIITETVTPYLTEIAKDLRPTGFILPEYAGLRSIAQTQILSMDFAVKAPAKKAVSWDAVPCIYSICTVGSETPKGPLMARLKRVENFREMDAARILVTELYGQVQYGNLGLQDIVDELVSRSLADSEDSARFIIADVLKTTNEMDGEIVERPGFPMHMEIDNEDNTMEIVVSGMTSVYYLDTVGIYLDAIIKMTQLYKEKTHLLKQLNRACKKARKFEEVREDEISSPPAHLTEAVRAPTIVTGPAKYTGLEEDDFFAQFDSEDDADEAYSAPGSKIDYREDDDEDDAINLIDRLHANVQKTGPILFEDEESPEKEPQVLPNTNGPILFEDDDDEEDELPDSAYEDKEDPPESPNQIRQEKSILQFHSKSKLLSAENEYKPYLDAGMPNTGLRDLSNFSDHSVEYGGLVFATVEHAFQSQKYAVSGHPEIVKEFAVNGDKGWTALEAKTQGGRKAMEKRGIELSISKWEKESIPIMRSLIQSKIERHEDIRKILEVAKQMNVQFAHFSRSDMKWGCHLSEDGKSIKNGKNLLGEMYNEYLTLLTHEVLKSPTLPAAAVATEAVSIPTIAQPKNEPILFEDDGDDEEEYADGGAKNNNAEKDDADADADADDDGENRLVPDGIPLKPDNPILRRLKKRDPELFMTQSKGKYKGFSVSCQPTSRHPVILTQEEFDRLDPESYEHSIKYGSDPKKQHHFICPRFWCFLTNSAISEADVKAGKCGKIIPKGADKVPKGAYVYELNSKKTQYPGFREDTRADGKCLPCCFTAPWDSKTQSDTRARCEAQMNTEDTIGKPKLPGKKKAAIDKKTAQYIISLDTFPVPEKRWGFLPIPVQMFLNIDYRPALDPGNPALLLPGKSVLLRYGVEQPDHQSFLGCFAHIFAHRQGLDKVPSVAEFRKILTERVTLDVFVRLHNGSLLSTFYPKDSTKRKPKNLGKDVRAKYADADFAAGLNVTADKAHARYFDDAILSYENFVRFLNDPNARIDHRYLWDLVCQPNERITPNGLNLVIMEIKANDMIDRIELVCPTNLYSNQQFDSEKDTVILLKHDEFYDPIFVYESPADSTVVEPRVVRFFKSGKINAQITNVLKNVELATRKFCPGMPSLPTIYKFASPVTIKRMLEGLAKIDAKVTAQVLNYQGKTIGLMVKEKEHRGSVYIPCAPSARLHQEGQNAADILYMDDLSILRDYEKTAEVLYRISAKTGIPCRPVRKIKEGGMVVGFLTETNQFVPIKPNEDIIMDGLRSYEGVDAVAADKTMATSKKADREREKMTKYIVLESQFYHAFRNRARTLLNEFANRKLKRDLMKIADEHTLLYSQKMPRIESMIRELIEDYVIFADIDKHALLDMAAVNECEDIDDAGPNCIIKENDGIAQLVIPKKHLLSKHDNERIYVGRLADELLRNERVQLFMYDTANRLNARNVDYIIKDDEFVLVKSALTPEYFKEIDTTGETNVKKYDKITNYETANPSISVLYPDEKIPLDEQYQAPKIGLEEDSHECLVNVVPIVGNKKQIWKRIFPDSAREWIFRDTAHCTFQPIARIVESVLGEKWSENDTKRRLCEAYLTLFSTNPEFLKNVVAIMRKQGKSKMFERFIRAKSDLTPDSFESIVISDDYYLSDLDYWIIADKYNLPIILFNPNGLKGFFSKSDVQWIRLGGDVAAKYHFVRSNIGSFATHIYEYNLIVPAVTLKQTKEFETVVEEATQNGLPNAYRLEDMLSRILVVQSYKAAKTINP